MKHSFFGNYLNVLFYLGLLIWGGSILFTVITHRSPLEFAGISAEAATVGAIVLGIMLMAGPRLLIWLNSRD